MKKISFFALVFIGLATVVFGADPKLDAIVARATRDPKNAALIVAIAGEENPKIAARLVNAAVAALPDHAIEIVGATLEALPKQRVEILRAAILGQPKMAVEITSTALAMFPDQATEIMKNAIEVSPENLRTSIATLGNKAAYFDSGSSGGARPQHASFPAQPIRPDLVSPSH